jgi:hypothetical protein
MPGRSLMDAIMGGSTPEDVSALNILYDTKDYSRQKQLSEIPASLVYVMTILGTIQKRYKSKLLKDFDVELLLRQKSRDRKGVGEAVEVLLGMSRMEGEGNE